MQYRRLWFNPLVGRSPGEGNGNHSSILAWRISWTELPGRLQSKGSQRVNTLSWQTNFHFHSIVTSLSGTLKSATLCWGLRPRSGEPLPSFPYPKPPTSMSEWVLMSHSSCSQTPEFSPVPLCPSLFWHLGFHLLSLALRFIFGYILSAFWNIFNSGSWAVEKILKDCLS